MSRNGASVWSHSTKESCLNKKNTPITAIKNPKAMSWHGGSNWHYCNSAGKIPHCFLHAASSSCERASHASRCFAQLFLGQYNKLILQLNKALVTQPSACHLLGSSLQQEARREFFAGGHTDPPLQVLRLGGWFCRTADEEVDFWMLMIFLYI